MLFLIYHWNGWRLSYGAQTTNKTLKKPKTKTKQKHPPLFLLPEILTIHRPCSELFSGRTTSLLVCNTEEKAHLLRKKKKPAAYCIGNRHQKENDIFYVRVNCPCKCHTTFQIIFLLCCSGCLWQSSCCNPNFSQSIVSRASCQDAGTSSVLTYPNMDPRQLH